VDYFQLGGLLLDREARGGNRKMGKKVPFAGCGGLNDECEDLRGGIKAANTLLSDLNQNAAP
jgi:hypothetical protein